MKQDNHKQGLAPLVGKKPRILILGSLPSDESIKRQEYYGNPKNLFWRVIAGVYGETVPESYSEKKDLLFRHNIALWDVCASADREGSLDAKIKDVEFNDLGGFIKKYPSIHTIVLNGGKAATEYRKFSRQHNLAILGREECFFTSTSALSVSAGWPLERIIEQWSAITRHHCCIPLDLYPRINGIEKVMRILGPNYEFHDSEVDSFSVFKEGVVVLSIWSGWADNADGEYITRWQLNSCAGIDTCGYDPNMCWLSEMRIETEGKWLKLILDGVGPVFSCLSIDVSIKKVPEKDERFD